MAANPMHACNTSRDNPNSSIDIDQLAEMARQIDCNASDALDAIVSEMIRCDIRELHLEQETQLCRIRHRINGELTESRISGCHALTPRLVQHIRSSCHEKTTDNFGSVTFQPKSHNSQFQLRADYYTTANGHCLTLLCRDCQTVPTALGQTGINHSAVQKLHRLIQEADRGITLIQSRSNDVMVDIHYALLGELNQVGKKIVSIEQSVVQAVPRISQITANDPALIAIATSEADVMVIDTTAIEEFHHKLIMKIDSGTPVFLLSHSATSASSLIRLRKQGFDTDYLDVHLQSVISLHELPINCPHCTDSRKLETREAAWLTNHSNIPETVARCSTLQGTGCTRCDFVGSLESVKIAEYSYPDNRLPGALESVDSKAVKAALQTGIKGQSACEQAERMLLDGLIDFKTFRRVWDS